MSKIDEPNAMELAPIAEARMIFERSSKNVVFPRPRCGGEYFFSAWPYGG